MTWIPWPSTAKVDGFVVGRILGDPAEPERTFHADDGRECSLDELALVAADGSDGVTACEFECPRCHKMVPHVNGLHGHWRGPDTYRDWTCFDERPSTTNTGAAPEPARKPVCMCPMSELMVTGCTCGGA